jgi:hypothetical protein
MKNYALFIEKVRKNPTEAHILQMKGEEIEKKNLLRPFSLSADEKPSATLTKAQKRSIFHYVPTLITLKDIRRKKAKEKNRSQKENGTLSPRQDNVSPNSSQHISRNSSSSSKSPESSLEQFSDDEEVEPDNEYPSTLCIL